ncbi:hypothetical protein [Amycolatopsis keratiniphila]|uniref:hypothetical protein n=1 Tax=Amycolatopsis keratiniphila TaxID=129921 RepID=UPI00039D8296|nr:hypothetical protein [Amycolatopsis keratiniphila]
MDDGDVQIILGNTMALGEPGPDHPARHGRPRLEACLGQEIADVRLGIREDEDRDVIELDSIVDVSGGRIPEKAG